MSGNNAGFSPSQPVPRLAERRGRRLGASLHAWPLTSGFLFASNQVSAFDLSVNDPVTKGRSGGTASCWVATYNTPHEAPTVTITTPANGANYAQGSTVNAAYTCQAVNAGSGSPTGPYLDVAVGCTGTVPSGSPIDTSSSGMSKVFTATVMDSATDSAHQR